MLTELQIKTGDAFTTVTALMNSWYRQWANDYGFLYADISNVESVAGENGWTFLSDEYMENTSKSSHPSIKGHEKMAEAVLKVLPENTATDSSDYHTKALNNLLKSRNYNYVKELISTPTVVNLSTLIKSKMVIKNFTK